MDNLNLIYDFENRTHDSDPEFKGKTFKVVENRGDLNSIDVNEVDYLLGTIQQSYLILS